VIGVRPYPRYHGNVIWPPSEADSLILQVMWGCSYGKCAFCGAYMGKAFRLRPVEAIKEDIQGLEDGLKQNVTRVFLCDGDALSLPLPRMIDILDTLAAELPSLSRVSAYANAHSLQPVLSDELREMREHGLEMLYVGLESGDDPTLLQSGKGLSSAQLTKAFLKAKEAGFALSVTAILGLGGKERSIEHARATGRALSAIDPQGIGILSLAVEPGTRIEEWIRRDKFTVPDAPGLLRELREIIAEIDVTQAVFRTDYDSADLALAGNLPADKQALLDKLDKALAEGDQAPGNTEDLRAL
jgi:radical SAM superfamily enzyme YgiQ (UPF0313 family)